MDEDSADDDKFSNVALCICNAAENICASEEELAQVQVRLATNAIMKLMYIIVHAVICYTVHFDKIAVNDSCITLLQIELLL